jgi:hypothetical protein
VDKKGAGMYYSDKPTLTLKEYINQLQLNDPIFYAELTKRNYKFWQSSTSGHYLNDILAQKCIYDGVGNKLFFIDCFLYIYDKERFPLYPESQEKVKCMIESRFYLDNNEDRYCTVQLNIKDLDYAEKFFLEFFAKYNCIPYEKAN